MDAAGMVVAPGFVDILAGGFSLEGNHFKVTDGVTTLLSMHGGPVDVDAWYGEQEREGRIVHFGTTVGHGSLREAVGVTDREAAATPEQIAAMERLARKAIMDGAVGIGFGVQYVPGASEAEVLALFRVAAGMGVPCHLHPRFLGPVPPSNAEKGVQEVIAAAAATGASAQIVHLPAMAGHEPSMMRTVLDLIEGARAHGVDVAADAYPWNAGQTSLESAVFDPGWQERMSVSYGDLMLASTGERLTRDTFRRYREDGERTSVIIFHVKEESTDMAFGSPAVMVGSDGGIRNGRGHPRGAGTYAKFLRTYVWEEGALT
ncbi:MAG: D-glutamate deacylase, partial [Gemmatimonadetes bacterium]|nr:D-glutamate deacylase [Gemmatimonadota bacterium]NIR78915.1 D-glutamate deacylase [Gemmatimonadota bacterium]NIT87550.1 D-glutamate deacylase [Gemmatimonadota bacterium]NIU31418.1 D-glutamate deacylase [Gemmatimonadota bacterium]NIU36103.1 D-glutamate deacylase [Gemmatimonadota bacterium]